MIIESLYTIYREWPHVATDTRKSVKHKMFFCLKGPNFDANSFVPEALERGAVHVVSDDEKYLGNSDVTVVKDVLRTLQELAMRHRETFSFPVIGLTGSNGKTTNKELIRTVLAKKYRTFATDGNLNNHIGVPLTLLSIPNNAGIAIVEMGANHRGEIRELCRIAKPNYGLITNIGKAHLEGFGGAEGVVQGKKELYDFIRAGGGKVFVNADDPLLMELSNGIPRELYGSHPDALVSGQLGRDSSRVRFTFSYKGGVSGEVKTNMVGKYNYANFLAAACLGCYFGVPPETVRKALAAYTPTNNRSQYIETEYNRLILDAYNANPSSMELALTDFAAMDNWPKIALIGHMLELGDSSRREHQRIVDLVHALDIPAMLVGEGFESSEKGNLKYFPNAGEFRDHLKRNPLKGHLILLKGSRGIAMEKAVSLL